MKLVAILIVSSYAAAVLASVATGVAILRRAAGRWTS